MTEYSQGVCEDGAAILKDGQMMTIEDIVATLTDLNADRERLQHLINSGAFRVGSLDMGSNHTWCGAGRPIGKGGTIRQAIDGAILSTHNGGEK